MGVPRWGAAAAALAVVAIAGCSGDGESPATTSTAPTPTFMGDGSAFCNAMLSVGQIAGAEGASAQEVLDANEQLVSQLDEAQANTPADAPADFEALVDDYRVATDAIFKADGDIDKAFEALQRDDPDVYARLGSDTSHQEAYDFLVERCGINPP